MTHYLVFTWSGRSLVVLARSVRQAVIFAARLLSGRPLRNRVVWRGNMAHVAGFEFWRPLKWDVDLGIVQGCAQI